MSDIKFNCPHCGQHIACNPEAAGQSTNCPSCKWELNVPGKSRGKEVTSYPSSFPPQGSPSGRGSRKVWVVMGIAGVLCLAVTSAFILRNRNSKQEPVGAFDWVSWSLTNTYRVELADSFQTHKITENGKEQEMCYLVVQCRFLPGIVPDNGKWNDQFRVVMTDGSTILPEVCFASKVVRGGRNPNEPVVQTEGTLLFTVRESIAQTAGSQFSFKQYPPVELTTENKLSVVASKK